MNTSNQFNLAKIATVKSPYKQKFAIPRQPNLVKEAKGELIFETEYSDPNSLRAIEQFSHLWLLFIFHETAAEGWSPTVQPPRLGGKESIGVYATRSTYRPNPIGMSVVENLGWEQKGKLITLKVGGLDLLDGTPIVDIKPYIAYADSITEAKSGFAESPPGSQYAIQFSAESEQQLTDLNEDYPNLKEFISAILQQDPRPAWRKKEVDEKSYGMSLYDLNIKWRHDKESIHVLSIKPQQA